jgi:hypothetical protein
VIRDAIEETLQQLSNAATVPAERAGKIRIAGKLRA